MNKLFILAALLAVAFAATRKECNTLSADACTECKDTETSKVCQDTLTGTNVLKGLECGALVQCYTDVAEAKEAKDEAEMKAMQAKLCPSDKAKCSDTSAFCATWANDKQCTANPEWMLVNCAQSCCNVCTGKNTLETGTCPDEDSRSLCVKNTHSSCHAWATQDKSECTENAKWMIPNCMESCCDTCKFREDKCPTVKGNCANDYAALEDEGDDKCAEWAKKGECTANPVWMKENCAKECCSICVPVAPARPTTQQNWAQPIAQNWNYPTYAQPRFGGYNTGFNTGFGLNTGYNFGLPYAG